MATRFTRRGMTTTELLGCVFCLAGGLWIGANYLGVDLNKAAYVALDETELLGQLPDDWRPENPDCPDGDCPDPSEVRRAERQLLDAELAALRLEVARLRAGAPGVQQDNEGGEILDEQTAVARDRTVVYWQELSEIVGDVTKLHERIAQVADPQEQAHVLVVRRRALGYGQRAIGLLETDGVDPRALEAGSRLATWYTDSAATLEAAGDPATRPDAAGRAVSASRVLDQAQRQYEQQSDLVRRKTEETCVFLNTRYLVELPPLAL